MKYQDSYLESCWKKTIGKFASGKKREVFEKNINEFSGRYEEDPENYIFGKLLEENHRFSSMRREVKSDDNQRSQ